MSYLPQTNWGDCTLCENKDCACIKKGKSLVCVPCNNKEKADKKIENFKKKQAERNAATKLRKLDVRLVDNKAAKELDVLNGWFKERMERCEVKCENCGATNWWLENNKDTKNGKRKWKSCQAHLLPKRHFKSLMTHPLNGMVIGSGYSGLCNCHDDYDSSWDKASKMNIWDEVVRRFLIMYPLIKPEEQQFIPPQLLQEINQI